MKTPATILIIYDDSEAERTLCRTLGSVGYAVVTVAYGLTMMDVLRRRQPWLVILDVGLSEMRCQDLCLQIRSEFRNIIIFVMSATAEVGEVVQLLELGADDYITKPFAATEFLARVRTRTNRADRNDAAGR
jgi:two-component system, OmpR family, KDP operon response regulator KdpE